MSASTDASALVRRTRAAQGLPPTVEDATALAKVAQLLRSRNGEGALRGAFATIVPAVLLLRKDGRGGS